MNFLYKLRESCDVWLLLCDICLLIELLYLPRFRAAKILKGVFLSFAFFFFKGFYAPLAIFISKVRCTNLFNALIFRTMRKFIKFRIVGKPWLSGILQLMKKKAIKN